MRDDLNPDPNPEESSDNVASSRREFLIGLGRWSPAVIGGIFLGSRTREAAAWYNSGAWNNHAVEGSWVERYPGGGGWSNRGGAWANRGPGSGGWFNRGGAWINHNWANRYSGGSGWFNRGGGWHNHGRSWVNNAGRNWANRHPGGGGWHNHGRAWVNR